jgi:hypothetical protein
MRVLLVSDLHYSLKQLDWTAGGELFEYVCQDNNLSPAGMVGAGTSVDRSSSFVP